MAPSAVARRSPLLHGHADELVDLRRAADLARLKEFQAWIDGHPHSAELYAYLRSMRDL